MEGRRLLHYRLLEKIGEGGMGVVYKARDEKLGRLVAVKVLALGHLADTTSRPRFLREARAASALNHPNIITIHEIAAADGTEMIVMEYLDGLTLAEMIGGRGLPFDRVYGYGFQMADALARAHAAGVIHRDLKPGNVMITATGLVKVLDFGLAKLYEVPGGGVELDDAMAGTLTAARVVMGTAAYMSPEQAAGEPLDARTDVFSLGVVLYEMIAGQRAFQGQTTSEVLGKVLGREPTPIETVRPETPPALREILRRALAKSRDERFRSMADVRDALRAAEATQSGVVSGRADGDAPTVSIALPAPDVLADGASSRSRVATRSAGARWAWPVAAVLLGATLVVAWPALSDLLQAPEAGVASSSDTASTAFQHYQAGRTLLARHDRRENVDRAVAEFTEAIRLDDAYAPGYSGLADAYHRKNLQNPDPQWHRVARDAATKAVDLNPDLAIAHVSMANVLMAEARLDAAEAELQRAVALNPQDADAQMTFGALYAARRNGPAAEASYRRAIDLAPGAWQPLAELGQFLYKAARYQEAAEVWERCAQVVPDNATIHRQLAAAYHMLDRPDDAAAELQLALEIEPSATVYNNLGTLRFFQGRYSDAVPAFEKAVELRANAYLYWGNLGDAYRWTPGKQDQAAAAYTRAAQLAREALDAKADDVDLRASLALYLIKGGHREGALEELSVVEKADTRSPSSLFKAVIVYELAGERRDALAALERTLKAGYSVGEIRTEPELVSLRTDPVFHTIMARAEQRN